MSLAALSSVGSVFAALAWLRVCPSQTAEKSQTMGWDSFWNRHITLSASSVSISFLGWLPSPVLRSRSSPVLSSSGTLLRPPPRSLVLPRHLQCCASHGPLTSSPSRIPHTAFFHSPWAPVPFGNITILKHLNDHRHCGIPLLLCYQ